MTFQPKRLLAYVQWRKFWLILMPFLLCWGDAAVTLIGQPEQYWTDGYSRVNEGNPVARSALGISPIHFVLHSLGYTAIWAGAILLVSPRIALVVSLWVSMAHVIGIASWIYWGTGRSYEEFCVYVFVVAVALGASWFKSGYFVVRRDG